MNIPYAVTNVYGALRHEWFPFDSGPSPAAARVELYEGKINVNVSPGRLSKIDALSLAEAIRLAAESKEEGGQS